MTDTINIIYNIDILKYILINILAILVVGALYFVTKEIYRIRGGKVSKVSVGLIGSFLGVIVLVIYLNLSSTVFLGYDTIFANNDINEYLIYNGIILSPTIIIIMVFVIFVDRRLVFPLFLFQTIAFIIALPILDEEYSTVVVSSVIFELLLYSILIIIFYFVPSINFIKKNGILFAITITLYLIALFIIQTLYHISILNFAQWIDTSSYFKIKAILIGYILIYVIPQFLTIWIVERVYSNFSALETFSTKDDVSYYKMSLAQNALVKMIDEERISIGLVMLLQIKTDNENIKSRILDKIRLSTSRKYKNTFYFKASATYYGVFFELPEDFKLDVALSNNKAPERTEDDVLEPITRELDRISKEESVQIIASGSIYGLQSYSITELIEHARYLMTPVVSRANANSLIIYDFKRVKERLNETTKVRSLPLDTEKMNISFLRGLSSELIYYPSISFSGDDGTFFQIINSDSLTIEQKNILLRYTSYQVLRKFGDREGHLVLYYPLSFLSSDEFKLRDFIKKINRYIDEKRVIIGIDTSMGNLNDYLEHNLNDLRQIGVKIASINPSTITQEQHDFIKPDYIIDISMDKNPLKIEKINIKISTKAILLNANLVN